MFSSDVIAALAAERRAGYLAEAARDRLATAARRCRRMTPRQTRALPFAAMFTRLMPGRAATCCCGA